MSWLANVLAGDSKIKSELEELARKSKDESLPARERLEAMFQLGSIVQAGERLQETVDQLAEEIEEDNEPKYVWKNGARVRVK